MKKTLPMNRAVLLCAVISAAGIINLRAQTTDTNAPPADTNAPPPSTTGSGTLHFSAQTKMANQGVLPKASGKVKVQLEENRNSTRQMIDITLNHLDSNAAYSLGAGTDTNVADVLDFTSDAHGNASIHFQDNGNTTASTHAGHIRGPIPDGINPVTGIGQLGVFDTNGAPVLVADLSAPDKWNYLVKRDISSDGTKASLSITANQQRSRVQVKASGLTAGSDYSLALDGNVVQTATADKKGRVTITADQPANVLGLSSVALLDSDGNTVASTTLP
ncbi:MAG TPA: hypothetical protein VLT36_01455 [Candidatus Dormibacteraeota bacterium]|nr:hypothetical protein [Candidatus Dormibacteraeota bacterium]